MDSSWTTKHLFVNRMNSWLETNSEILDMYTLSKNTEKNPARIPSAMFCVVITADLFNSLQVWLISNLLIKFIERDLTGL